MLVGNRVMGLGATLQQNIQGSIAGGLQIAAPFAGPFAPLVEIAALATSLLPQFGCGQTCTLTSNEANSVADYMQKNLDYFNASPKTAADQQQAISNFMTAWGQLVQYCSNPQMGNAGKRCIADRSGSRNGGNGKYDWFAYYYDPIVNSHINPTSVSSGDVISSLTGGGNMSIGLVVGLALIGIGIVSLK
jgi:hypothetical protein